MVRRIREFIRHEVIIKKDLVEWTLMTKGMVGLGERFKWYNIRDRGTGTRQDYHNIDTRDARQASCWVGKKNLFIYILYECRVIISIYIYEGYLFSKSHQHG